MTENEIQNEEGKPASPNPPPTIVAGFACLLSLPIILLLSSPLIKYIHANWAEKLHFTLIILVPVSVTFFFLYRSSWHQDSPRVRRILSSVLSSCIIFGLDVFLVAVAILLACLFIGLGRSVGGN